MKRWWLVVALALSLAVNLGVLVTLTASRWIDGKPRREWPRAAAWEEWAHGPRGLHGGPRHHRPPRELARLVDRLDLEGAPRERFLELQRELLIATLEGRQRRRGLEAELRQELAAAAPDQARIEEILVALGEAYVVQERALARTILGSRELLDDEQEQLYLAVLAHLREHTRHGLGRSH